MTLLPYFLFSGLFLAFSAFFSSMETSLFSLTPAEKQDLTRKNKSLKGILSSLNNALIAILFANTFVNIGFSLAVDKILFRFLGHGTTTIIASIFTATILVLILGEVFPKNFAIFHKDILLKRGSLVLQYVILLLTPITASARFLVSFVIRRTKKFIPRAYPKLMKDELMNLAGLHRRKSAFNAMEKFLLQNITKISQLNAGDIVTPRVKTNMVDGSVSEENIKSQLKKFKHKYVPVYTHGIDDITGIIDVKNYLLSDSPLKQFIRKPFFVPETKKILPLLAEMKEKKAPLCIIVDEFGGFVGIVTAEDIVEEITGDISDEFDEKEMSIKKIRKNHYIVPGDMKIEDVQRYTRINFNGDPTVTLNAFILQACGMIPQKGHHFKIDDRVFVTITKASKRKVIEAELKII